MLGLTAGLRRWGSGALFVLIGTALATSLLSLGAIATLGVQGADGPAWRSLGLAAAIGVVVAFVIGLLPAIRQVEVTAAESFLGAQFPAGWASAEPGGMAERIRAAAWFTGHVVFGGGFGAMLLFGIPFSLDVAWGTPLVLIAAVVVALPLLATWPAEVVLGPSPRELMAINAAEQARLADRNAVARDLHDSVGHDLSLIAILTAAALRTDNESGRRSYLEHVEGTARSALGSLDEALQILRDGEGQGVWKDTLADLDALVSRFETAGLKVDLDVIGDLAALPTPISREGYRIVAEAMSNALRHSTSHELTLHLNQVGQLLTIDATNPHGTARARPRRTGRGLTGIRERVLLLGGDLDTGPDGDRWRVRVELPLGKEHV